MKTNKNNLNKRNTSCNLIDNNIEESISLFEEDSLSNHIQNCAECKNKYENYKLAMESIKENFTNFDKDGIFSKIKQEIEMKDNINSYETIKLVAFLYYLNRLFKRVPAVVYVLLIIIFFSATIYFSVRDSNSDREFNLYEYSYYAEEIYSYNDSDSTSNATNISYTDYSSNLNSLINEEASVDYLIEEHLNDPLGYTNLNQYYIKYEGGNKNEI